MSLAHEGNPKEDSITINAGELISPATLSMPFIFGGGPSGTRTDDDGTGVPPPDTSDHCSCEESMTATPCTTDYMSYCYDGNMVQWSNNPLLLTFWNGDGGCSGGSQTRWALNAAGVNSVGIDCSLGGGFAIYYGELNPNQIGAGGNVVEAHAFGLKNFTSNVVFSSVVGAPAFGIAINVPQNATCSSFSGLVVLFDWGTNNVTLGTYSNADLNNGDLPTTIATLTSIPDISDLNEIVLQNGYPELGVPQVEVYLNGWDEYAGLAYVDPPAIALADTTIGHGFFWLRSPSEVNPSSLVVSYDDNTQANLTFV